MCSLPTAAVFQFFPGLGTCSISPHFCGCSNVIGPSQGSSCAGESGLYSLECVDHCHPFFLQDVPEQRRRWSFFFGKEVSCHGLVFVVIPGDADPIVEVGHDAVSLPSACPWSVFRRHPARRKSVSAQVARLLACCGFGGHYITIAVMSSRQFRSLMASALPCTL